MVRRHKKAYGLDINARMACPLLQRLLAALAARAAGGSDARALLLVAHGETLVPLLTALGLFRDARPLTAALPRAARAARTFRASGVLPMAANLQLALLRCHGRPCRPRRPAAPPPRRPAAPRPECRPAKAAAAAGTINGSSDRDDKWLKRSGR